MQHVPRFSPGEEHSGSEVPSALPKKVVETGMDQTSGRVEGLIDGAEHVRQRRQALFQNVILSPEGTWTQRMQKVLEELHGDSQLALHSESEQVATLAPLLNVYGYAFVRAHNNMDPVLAANVVPVLEAVSKSGGEEASVANYLLGKIHTLLSSKKGAERLAYVERSIKDFSAVQQHHFLHYILVPGSTADLLPEQLVPSEDLAHPLPTGADQLATGIIKPYRLVASANSSAAGLHIEAGRNDEAHTRLLHSKENVALWRSTRNVQPGYAACNMDLCELEADGMLALLAGPADANANLHERGSKARLEAARLRDANKIQKDSKLYEWFASTLASEACSLSPQAKRALLDEMIRYIDAAVTDPDPAPRDLFSFNTVYSLACRGCPEERAQLESLLTAPK